MNLDAFLWGRRAALDEAAVRAVIGGVDAPEAETLERHHRTRRVEFLTAYQDQAYAETYRDFVSTVRKAETPFSSERLTLAVARSLFKLMAYKDEYEVARLYTDGTFARAVASKFKGDFRLKFHLAPPILGRRDEFTGRPRKSVFGPWMMSAFRLLARLKHLRGTRLDVFGYSSERKQERALIAEYRVDGLQTVETTEPLQPSPRGRDRGTPRTDPRLRLCEGRKPGEDAQPGRSNSWPDTSLQHRKSPSQQNDLHVLSRYSGRRRGYAAAVCPRRRRPLDPRRRQDQPRRRSLAKLAFERDVAVMQECDLAGDRKAQADAADAPVHAVVGLHEGLEDAFHVFRADAAAAIAHGEGQPAILCLLQP